MKNKELKGWDTPTERCGAFVNESLNNKESVDFYRGYRAGYIEGMAQGNKILADIEMKKSDLKMIDHEKKIQENLKSKSEPLIAIKGMQMPESCFSSNMKQIPCRFGYLGTCVACFKEGGYVIPVEDYWDSRHPSCPLVPIEDNGKTTVEGGNFYYKGEVDVYICNACKRNFTEGRDDELYRFCPHCGREIERSKDAEI